MSEQPIASLEQAQQYFESMGCSHFHMAREHPARYDEYTRLGISRQQEEEWTARRLEELARSLAGTSADALWRECGKMIDLVLLLKSSEAVHVALGAARSVCDRMPAPDRVIVAEDILGRSHQGGLVHLAHDLRDLAAARALVELSLRLATPTDAACDRARCERAAAFAADVRAELGF